MRCWNSTEYKNKPDKKPNKKRHGGRDYKIDDDEHKSYDNIIYGSD